MYKSPVVNYLCHCNAKINIFRTLIFKFDFLRQESLYISDIFLKVFLKFIVLNTLLSKIDINNA